MLAISGCQSPPNLPTSGSSLETKNRAERFPSALVLRPTSPYAPATQFNPKAWLFGAASFWPVAYALQWPLTRGLEAVTLGAPSPGRTVIILLGGGLPIRFNNQVIGGIGVAGAPSGQLDEDCAAAGLAFMAAGVLGLIWAVAWLYVTRGERAVIIDTLPQPDPGQAADTRSFGSHTTAAGVEVCDAWIRPSSSRECSTSPCCATGGTASRAR